MKKPFLLMAIVMTLALIATACTQTPEENPKTGNPDTAIACTMDAKVCADGSAVGRVAPDCAFAPCPPVYTKTYVKEDPEECKLIMFKCIPGSEAFFDEKGCGCQAEKKYIAENVDECSRIRYMCEAQYVPFSDEIGCGCEFSFEVKEPEKHNCGSADDRPEVCTREYVPVCGYQAGQCTQAPCPVNPVKTYGNGCEACSDINITLWIEGECP